MDGNTAGAIPCVKRGGGSHGPGALKGLGHSLRWAFRTRQKAAITADWYGGRRIHTGEASGASHYARRAKVWLGTLLRTDKARKWLFNGIHLIHCEAKIRLALSDAAQTALLSGALTTLGGWLPGKVQLHVIPDFWSGHSAFALRAAVATRLGTLVITAALVLAAWIGERAEHPKHKEGT